MRRGAFRAWGISLASTSVLLGGLLSTAWGQTSKCPTGQYLNVYGAAPPAACTFVSTVAGQPVSLGGPLTTRGAFTTGGAFSTGSTFSTTGAFSTGGTLSTAGALSFADLASANTLLYTTAVRAVGGLATINNGLLSTNGSGVPTWLNVGVNPQTFLVSPTSANLRTLIVDETGTGLAYFQGGDLGTPSAGVGTNLTALNATQLTSGTLPVARLALSQQYSALGSDVNISNSVYTTGPGIAQGSTGTWFAFGKVTISDTAGAVTVKLKLWDGTTVIDSANVTLTAANENIPVPLAGIITSPAGNIQISAQTNAALSTTTKFLFNSSGNSRDSSLTIFRLN